MDSEIGLSNRLFSQFHQKQADPGEKPLKQSSHPGLSEALGLAVNTRASMTLECLSDQKETTQKYHRISRSGVRLFNQNYIIMVLKFTPAHTERVPAHPPTELESGGSLGRVGCSIIPHDLFFHLT
jgi:hypothetical protein